MTSDRYYVTIGTNTMVKKQANLVGCALEAKGWALKGYRPALQKEEGAYPTGVVRFQRQPEGDVVAYWDPHPFHWNTTPPVWADTVTDLINNNQGEQ